jgi:hypothetical protein
MDPPKPPAILVVVVAVDAVVALPDKLPIKLGAVILLLNVFAPAIVCVPLVTIPPLVPSAGERVNVVPLIVAPFILEVPLIDPTVLAPDAAKLTVLAAVILPFASTVNVGMAEEEPYEPAVTPLLASVVLKVPVPVPVRSPVNEII